MRGTDVHKLSVIAVNKDDGGDCFAIVLLCRCSLQSMCSPKVADAHEE